MKDVKNLTDEELVVLVRDQDQELYRFLVQRYEAKLRRYAYYLVKDEEKAADVVQEAFIKAFINLKSFKTKKKFSSWLYRIVHNQAVNQLKKEKKIISLEKSNWLEYLPGRTPEMIEELSKKEIRLMVKKLLGKMSLIYGEPLALYYLEEKSYEEISDILRLPLGTVGTRINRGKIKLKKIYQKENG